MSIKLSYFEGETENIRYINPAGTYSLVLTRDKHRYKEEFNGEMVISGDDFQWVMDAGKCTEIFVECTFKRVWNGVFTHTDCKIINLSKKYLEVTPRVDDEYNKFEPWMGSEFNIVPPFNGVNSKVPVYSVNQYGIETRTIRINEPYDGFVAEGKTWEGYSVNDWIAQTPASDALYGKSYIKDPGRNSLIWVLFGGGFSAGYVSNSGPINLAWQDPLFYDLRVTQEMSLDDVDGEFIRRYWRESFFTLCEVYNYYDTDGVWQYCDLLYKREFFDGSDVFPPTSGDYHDPNTLNTDMIDSIGIYSGKWMYNPSAKKWYRFYYGAHSELNWNSEGSFTFDDYTEHYTDGNSFTELIDVKGDGTVKAQVLKWNQYQANLHGRSEGSPTGITKDDIASRFFNDDTNPYTNDTNIWKNVLIGQNSDVKRPLATEQATKETMTFTDYMNMLCSLTNTAWAIIDREFVIEHVSYFEKGLTYGFLPESSNILNPYSIINVAKNKGFMELTDAYSFDKANMPKFEIFKTDGGVEPKNNNTKIEYTSGCVNNLPRQNIKEISLDTTLDYEYARSEGNDAGVTFLSTTYEIVPGIPPVLMNKFFPAEDEFGRYVFNPNFTLEDVIRDYHSWGRSDDAAKLNGVEWTPIQPFKNVIQNVEFRYKLDEPLMENPYAIVATGIGYGIIRNLTYETKGSYLLYELGMNPIENAVQPETVMDWHLHTQSVASDTWTIEHSMNNVYMFRPVAFDNSGNEIEYDSLFIPSLNQIIVTFSEPVSGTMHFIAMNLSDDKIFYQDLVGATSASVNAPLLGGIDQVGLGLIIDSSGYEIIPESTELTYEVGVGVTLGYTFSAPITARVSMANITGGYMDNVYNQDFTGDSVDVARTNNFIYTKPLVLQADREIFYNSQQLLTALTRIGFSESVIATIIVTEKSNT